MNSNRDLLAYLREMQQKLALDSNTPAQSELLEKIISSLEKGEFPTFFDQSQQKVDSQLNVFFGQNDVPKTDSSRGVYLNYIRNRCENVPLRGLGLSANISNPNLVRNQRMRLSKIYVDLETTSSEKMIDRDEWWHELGEWGATGEPSLPKPIPVLDAVSKNKHIVILGAPGSGKTTFIRYLALCISSFQLEGTSEWLNTLPRWNDDDFLLTPIVVNLRDFNRWLKRRSPKGSASLLWQFLEEDVENFVVGYFKGIQDDVYNGKAIIFFDGLDEVDVTKRQIITDSIISLADICSSRIITTCRVLSYNDPKWRLEGFAHYELAPLESSRIEQFIDLWHSELVQSGSMRMSDANELKTRFRQSLRQNQELWAMAANPLLLDSMALVHTHEGFLPQDRALLYEDCVDLLLWNWEELKIPSGAVEEPIGIRSLLRQAGLQDIDFKRTFWKIAFDLFAENKDEIEIQDIVKAFKEIHPDRNWNWANNVVTAIQERAGLIVEHSEGRFSFPHRTFQEFLAASHLASLQDCASAAAKLASDPRWNEVVLLAVGRLVHISGDISKALDLIAEMLMRKDIEKLPEYGLFGSELLAEIGILRIRDKVLGQDLLNKSVNLLTNWLSSGVFNSRDKKRLGCILSLLGDPRFDVKKLYLPKKLFPEVDELLLGFILISDGSYSDDHATPNKYIELPEYYMARYPVTEAQYWQFIQETNRTLPLHWINGRPLPQRMNCPVVNVNWYDALAYCRWLSRRIGNLELTEQQRTWWDTTDKLILLPNEAEWECACRGNAQRTYAWGHDFITGRTNTNDENLGESVSVGLFPDGASYHTVMDLGGNIREWTTTRYWDERKNKYSLPYINNDGREDLSRDDNVTRVLKGGAYNLDHFCSMCNYRTKNFPVDRHPYIGFRIVVHPK